MKYIYCRIRKLFRVIFTVAFFLISYPTLAASGLLDPRLFSTFNDAQKSAAIATQAIYDDLTSKSTLTSEEEEILNVITPIVENGYELTGGENIQSSLGLDAEGLGFALQWVGFEEVAAQSSISKEFLNTVSSQVASRLTALRLGATGFQVAGIPNVGSITFPTGGNAGDDTTSSLSGFARFSYAEGSKQASSNEDGFDFDASGFTLGLDYRFRDNTVIGVLVNYMYDQNSTFNSSQTAVDGDMSSKGWAIGTYGNYYINDSWFVDAMLMLQFIEFDMRRRIVYPSNNLAVPSVDETVYSKTDSNAFNLVFGTGYDFYYGSWFLTPSLQLNYLDISIDGFTESGGDSHAVAVQEQDIESIMSIASADIGYSFSTSFGVLVPALSVSWFHEFKDDPDTIQGSFIHSGTDFNFKTDRRDSDYFGIGASLQTLFPHDIQAYLSYHTLVGHDSIDDYYSISAGVRYEF